MKLFSKTQDRESNPRFNIIYGNLVIGIIPEIAKDIIKQNPNRLEEFESTFTSEKTTFILDDQRKFPSKDYHDKLAKKKLSQHKLTKKQRTNHLIYIKVSKAIMRINKTSGVILY